MTSKNLYWASWQQPTHDYRPFNYPPHEAILAWWCSGYNTEGVPNLIALISAENTTQVREVVEMEWPEFSHWRFLNVIPEIPNFDANSRFPLNDWQLYRIDKWKQDNVPPSINIPSSIVDSPDGFRHQELEEDRVAAKAEEVAEKLKDNLTKPPLMHLKDYSHASYLYNDVIQEIVRSREIHPQWPLNPFVALTIAQEEVGEAAKALLQYVHEPDKRVTQKDIRNEVIQAIAMLFEFSRFMEHYDYKPCRESSRYLEE